MTFLFKKTESLEQRGYQLQEKPTPSLEENWNAATTYSKLALTSTSKAKTYQEILQPVIDEMNAANVGETFHNPSVAFRIQLFEPEKQTSAFNQSLAKLNQAIDRYPEFEQYRGLYTPETVASQAAEMAKNAREDYLRVSGESPSTSAGGVRTLGEMYEGLDDPILISSMLFGGAKKLWGMAFQEAALGAGSEALAQIPVQRWHQETGMPYTNEQYWNAVKYGGAIGFAFPFAFRGAGKAVSITTEQAKKGIQAIRSTGARQTPDGQIAEDLATELEEIVADNPLNTGNPDDIIVYSPNGTASVAQVVKRSESGGIIVRSADGKEKILELDELSQSTPYDPNFKLETIEGAPAVKDLDDVSLAASLETLERKIKAQAETGKPNYGMVRERNAIKIEQKRRAGEQVVEPETPTLPNRIAAEAEHEQRLADAVAAVDENVAPTMPDASATPPRPLLSVTDADKVDGLVKVFDPDEVAVDAELFQFKAGGDEFGVTERLQGVTTWDPIAAGQIVVYEFADGRKFIADGHQRLGLAKRIKSQDPSQKIELLGHTLRESDGITPDMARVIAAVKNIKEGTGTAIDAAKVLRDAPQRAGELPPRSVLVQQARGLTLLDDETFGAIINGVVPANYGAIVGRLIPDDPGLQKNAIQVLSKTDPANEYQAESIVRQVIESGAETRTQESLFGEEIITESYFLERAKVLDQARKQLGQDKAAFASLLRNAQRLEAEGNQLAQKANERRASNDSQAIGLLQAQANRKGPLSDALTAAARQARESGSYGQATRGFIEAVRRSIESGDFDRLSAGDVGQSINAPTEGRASATEPEPDVSLFDDPNGPGVQRQADQLENDLVSEEQAIGRAPAEEPPVVRQEGFQEDVDLRQDLKRLIDEGADETIIDAHPAVIQALEEAQAIPQTVDAPDFGSQAWQANRTFNFDGEEIIGYDNAIFKAFEDAQTLPYREMGLDVPDAPVSYDRKATILIGPPAAGKSTLANPIAIEQRAAIIDSDEIKKAMPEYQGGIGAMAVHEESSQIAKGLLNTVKDFGLNVVVPKVGDSPASIRKLQQELKDAGYEVKLINMEVAYPEARRRMFGRFVETGRLLGPDYMRMVGDNPTQTYYTLKEEGVFDGYANIDNNGGLDVGPRLTDDSFNGPEPRTAIDGVQLQLERSRAERGAEGRPDEAAVPEAAPVSGVEQAQAAARQALDQTEIPIGSTVDDAGNQIAVTVTRRQMLDDIQQDKTMLDRLRECAV
jgi:predicted kinase